MKKKLSLLLICCLLLLSLAGCKTKTPEEIRAEKYEALANAALTLVQTYNDVAQTAIDNGWEGDFQTLKLMDQLADQIEEITAAVNDPVDLPDVRLDQMAALAQQLTDQLNGEVLPKVSETFQAPEEAETPAS
jgi:hypothetical protein